MCFFFLARLEIILFSEAMFCLLVPLLYIIYYSQVYYCMLTLLFFLQHILLYVNIVVFLAARLFTVLVEVKDAQGICTCTHAINNYHFSFYCSIPKLPGFFDSQHNRCLTVYILWK